MHINLDEVYRLIETAFELLMVVDKDEEIIYASRLLLSECGSEDKPFAGQKLKQVLSSQSYNNCKKAMKTAIDGQHASVVLASNGKCSLPLRLRYSSENGGIFLFFGTRLDELGKITEWEKEERIKELACLYSVSEWIEVSRSVREFFTELPSYLVRGMQYPEKALVYSVYQGVEYGQKVESDRYIQADLEVSKEKRGEIRVGYMDTALDFLPEEQKMLNEIARMLNLALERKEYRENLEHVKEEEEELADRIEKLKEEIKGREGEHESLTQNLKTVNSYLDRVSRDWEESKVRLETMFQAIPDRVAIIDLKRNVIMTNRENVIPGYKCHKTFFNSDKPCQDCRLVRVIREKTPVMVVIKHEDQVFEVHALPIFNQEHEVEGIIEFYRDITKETTYEQQLQQADKLASLGQLVSGIGHEINNPNQFIKGNIKIIQQAFEDILPILDDYAKEHPDLKIARLKYDFFREHILTLVKDMSHGSERIKGIVEGLRRFARRDEGQLIDNVDLNTIIDESARLVHNQIHKHADIELNLAPNIPTFTGNSQKIEQVIINLLINAGQAMYEGRKGLIEVTTRLERMIAVVEVKDNGIGMSDSTLKHIFDPFFTTKRAKGGTGLGLSIAYRIIDEHNGTISVSSKPGEGTTFTIRIPVQVSNRMTSEINE
jgi:signal transduction histidine kinase